MMGCRSYVSCEACTRIDTSAAGLISAWDFKPVAGNIPDLVGSNSGVQQPNTIFTYDKINSGMNFYGGVIPLGNKSDFKRNNFTISCILRPYNASATQGIFSSSSGAHYYVGVTTNGRLIFSTATAAGSANALYSFNNVVVVNLELHVVFTVSVIGTTVTKRIYANNELVGESIDNNGWNTNYGSSGFFIGGYSASTAKLNGKLACLEFYDHEKNDTWISDKYRKLKGKFSFLRLTDSIYYASGQIPYNPIYVKSGSVRVNNNVIDSSVLSTYYIPGGFISSNKKQNSYGRWNFNYTKKTASDSYITFICTDNNPTSTGSYRLTVFSDGTLSLVAAGVGTLFSTSSGFIQLNREYNFTIIRKYDGQFSVFVDNILVSVATGSNPVTNNNYQISNNFVLANILDNFSMLVKYHLP